MATRLPARLSVFSQVHIAGNDLSGDRSCEGVGKMRPAGRHRTAQYQPVPIDLAAENARKRPSHVGSADPVSAGGQKELVTGRTDGVFDVDLPGAGKVERGRGRP